MSRRRLELAVLVIAGGGLIVDARGEKPVATQPRLAGTPATVTVVGDRLVIGDHSGNLLWWRWPPDAAGPSVRAHDQSGPLAAVEVGAELVTTGGWDPTIKRWRADAAAPHQTIRPFDGRITAICGEGGHILVGGADRDRKRADPKGEKRPLGPGRLIRLGAGEQVEPVDGGAAVGEIAALACGPGWIAFLDGGAPDSLRWIRGAKHGTSALARGPATAVTASGRDVLVADRGGVWRFDLERGRRSQVAARTPDDLRVSLLVAVGDVVYGGTSEGLVRWPGGVNHARENRNPVSLATRRGALVVLWDDGLLEEREPPTGKVLRSSLVPQEP